MEATNIRCKLGLHKLDFREIGIAIDLAGQVKRVDYFCFRCQRKIKSVSPREVMFSKNDEQLEAYLTLCADWLKYRAYRVMTPSQIVEIVKVGLNKECDNCQWLLHYEYDADTRKHSMPRCCINFRKGNEVFHPCLDFLVSKYNE